jgi:hypothetical protein
MRRKGILTGIALLAAAAAGADVVIETETRDPRVPRGSGAPIERGRIWIDGLRLRAETGSSAGAGVVIFLGGGDGPRIWTLDPADRSYVEIDRETLGRVGERLARARREMEARMASLPPEQRAAVARMMGDRAPVSAPLEAIDTGESDQVGERTCRRYRLVRGGESQGDVCVLSWKEAGVRRTQLRVFRELARFQRDVIESLGAAPGGQLGALPFEVFDQLDGFPLRTRRLQDGTAIRETTFRLVDGAGRKGAGDARFALPADYRRRELLPGGSR